MVARPSCHPHTDSQAPRSKTLLKEVIKCVVETLLVQFLLSVQLYISKSKC